MTGEQFGQKLLAVIRAKANENSQEYIVAMKVLDSVVSRALGVPELETPPPPPTYRQPATRPEFPQIRVNCDSSGQELVRQTVNSFDHFEQIIRTNPEIVCWHVMPIEGAE
jgi:hypothetical protein